MANMTRATRAFKKNVYSCLMSSKFQKKLDKKATRIEGLSSTSLDFRKTFKNVQVCINYYALIIMLYRNHA